MLRYIIIAFFIASLGLPPMVQAQKKKRDKAKNTREAEFYFTEAQKYFMLEDYAKAMVLFEQSKELAPDNAAIYYKIAEIHERNDELDKALLNINKSLNLEENNKYYFLLAANIQTRLGNFKDAAALYEKMIGTIDNTHYYLLELAAIYMYQEEYDNALATYQRAEDYFGINEEITAQKQKILLDQNNLKGALEEGLKLVENNPENQIAAISHAELLVANGRDKDAISFLKAHLESYPGHVLANMYLGNIYLKLGEIKEAEKHLIDAFESKELDADSKIQTLAILRTDLTDFHRKQLSVELARRLIQSHEGIADAHSVYGDILFTLGNQEEARHQYLAALEIDGSNYTLWQNVLQMYLQDSKFDSVIYLSDKALELFPNQNSLYYYQGLANLRLSNYDAAVANFKHGKMLSTSDPKLISAFNGLLGEAYFGLKNYKLSDEAFDEALDYDPENPLVLNNYSYYLALRNENLDKAEEMAEKLTTENPGIAAYYDTYAWVLFKQKKYKQAKSVLAPAVENSEAKGTYHDHFGDILFKLGEIEKALHHWNLAKEKDGSIKNIDKKIAEKKLYE